MKEYFVYILKLSDGSFYKGMTDNLDKRISNHNKGKCNSTRYKLPFTLIHAQSCNSREEAVAWEKYFKSGYGREIITQLAEVVKWYTH